MENENLKRFDFSAIAYMGEYGFSVAGTIYIERGCNGYATVRSKLLSEMYDRVCSVKKENFASQAKKWREQEYATPSTN